MISDAAYLSEEVNHTYEIDIVLECHVDAKSDSDHKRHVTRQRIPCKPQDAKAIVLNLTLPDYGKDVRDENGIYSWIFHGVPKTLSVSGPLMHDRHRSDPRDMWLRKATLNVYEDAAAASGEGKPRDIEKLESCLRHLFGVVWPTEEVHLFLHTKYATGPPTVSELHRTKLYEQTR
jgi:hypothetical protein